jgi:DNA-binding response OmpR family regulator
MPKKKSILLIDDNPLLTRAFEGVLTDMGLSVSVAHSGIEGLQLIRDIKPDIVFVDLRMHDMSGFDVLTEAQKIENKPEIIVLTVSQNEDDRNRALELGATDYWIKSDASVDRMRAYLVADPT